MRAAAYQGALVIDASSSSAQLARAATILASGDGIVMLQGMLALRTVAATLHCEVLDAEPGAHRCAEEFKVLVENASRMLAASQLAPLLPHLPRAWSVVQAGAAQVGVLYEPGETRTWSTLAGPGRDDEKFTPGDRTMILGLRTAIYPVTDLALAKAWYTQVLGVAPYFDQPFYVGFAVGGFELGLLPDGEPGVAGPQPLWGVTDIEDAFERLVELGAVPLEPVTAVGEGIKVAAVKDPFGNRLGLIENPHFDAGSVR